MLLLRLVIETRDENDVQSRGGYHNFAVDVIVKDVGHPPNELEDCRTGYNEPLNVVSPHAQFEDEGLGRDKISRFQTHLRREKKRILYDRASRVITRHGRTDPLKSADMGPSEIPPKGREAQIMEIDEISPNTWCLPKSQGRLWEALRGLAGVGSRPNGSCL